MFGSSLPPVVGSKAHSLFTLLVFACVYGSGVQHIFHYTFVSIAIVLCTLCCQFLCIVHFLLSFGII
jgi:hypothetical protein